MAASKRSLLSPQDGWLSDGLVILLTGLVAFVLSRPSDLAPYEPR